MSALSPAWHVKKGTDVFPADRDGPEITYRPNNYSEAKITFDATPGGGFQGIVDEFAREDVTEVYIGDPDTTGVKMLTGIIDGDEPYREPSGRRMYWVHLVDWGSYLAAKRLFERKYFRSTNVSDVLSNTLSAVTDGTSTLTGNNIDSITTKKIKQFFEATYVKDVWNKCAEVANLDYFADEDKDLHAFVSGSKSLQLSGNTYKIQDIPPDATHKIMVYHKKPYFFPHDYSQSYRNVKVTNGIIEYFPKNLDQFQTDFYHDDDLGKNFSRFYSLGTTPYSVDVVGNAIKPVDFLSSEVLDPASPGIQRPALRFYVIDASFFVSLQVIPRQGDNFELFDINVDDWEEISFWFRNNLTGQTITQILLRIVQDGSNFWTLDMTSYLQHTDWRYHRLSIPKTSSLSEFYTGDSWVKTGNPTKMNWAQIDFTPATGYDAFSTLGSSQFFLYKNTFALASDVANPPTQKIIVDKSLTSLAQLQEFANSEHTRVNQIIKKPRCTIKGNTNFKRPAYMVDVDFSNTLGTGRSGTLRMDNIRHYLDDGVHLVDIVFNNSFYRP